MGGEHREKREKGRRGARRKGRKIKKEARAQDTALKKQKAQERNR